MFRTLLTGVAISSVLVLGFATRGHAQGDETKKAGQEAKQAGKAAGEATKDAAKAIGKATKKATKKAAKKLTPHTTSARCQDGTVQTGKTKTTACIDHGGVKN